LISAYLPSPNYSAQHGLIEKVEEIINRRIRYLIVSCDEKDIHLTQCPEAFQLWEKID
jgi:hypothetical protein